jgi:hypothetical protein
MSQSFEFYTQRADEAAAEARLAQLDNVRDRALRSEAAWRQMAERLLRVEEQRRIADVTRAARRDGEGPYPG